MQSLCTLRDHCRQWPRNTRYQAAATPYLGRTSTGWIAPACGWRTHSITSSAHCWIAAIFSMPSPLAHVRWRFPAEKILARRHKDVDDLSVLLAPTLMLDTARDHSNLAG